MSREWGWGGGQAQECALCVLDPFHQGVGVLCGKTRSDEIEAIETWYRRHVESPCRDRAERFSVQPIIVQQYSVVCRDLKLVCVLQILTVLVLDVLMPRTVYLPSTIFL